MNFHHTPRFVADVLKTTFPAPDPERAEHAYRVLVRDTGVCISPGSRVQVLFPYLPRIPGCDPVRTVYIGHYEGTPCFAEEISGESPVPGGYEQKGVRELYGLIPDEELGIAALAVQLTDFDRTTRFCARCGAEMQWSLIERAKVCPSCNMIVFPRISPAIIVLVRKGDEVLLARSHRFPSGIYSVIAGFVEPCETIEHAVHREVMEETGITITNLQYLGSEPWPFPHSLMIAFAADYRAGDIRVDGNEIESAGWFTKENVPHIPAPVSISRSLIDWWLRSLGE